MKKIIKFLKKIVKKYELKQSQKKVSIYKNHMEKLFHDYKSKPLYVCEICLSQNQKSKKIKDNIDYINHIVQYHNMSFEESKEYVKNLGIV